MAGMMTSCMSQIAGQIVRQQVKEATSQLAKAKDKKWGQINEKAYSDLLQKNQAAAGACFRVTNTKGIVKDFVLPSSEFAQLQTILQHTGRVPSADQGPLPLTLSRSYKKKLLLTDASGKVIKTLYYSNQWMKETEMEQLSDNRTTNLFEADWYLPDADYDAFYSLPSLRAAENWASTK